MADETQGVIKVLMTVVRHGETNHNLNRLLQGQIDIPLNETGKNQADLGGNALRKQWFNLVISSDLSRAHETAANILAKNESSKGISIEKDPLLRERSFGVYEDKPIKECVDAASAAGLRSFYEFVPEGAETEAQVQMRSDKFFKTLLQRLVNKCNESEGGSSVLVVSHGGWIRHLAIHLAGTKKITDMPASVNGLNCPNVGISQFNLEVNKKTGKLVRGQCLKFYSNEHVTNAENGSS